MTRLRLQDELKQIVARSYTTAILVTHDVDEAAFLADRIIVMRANPGRIAACIDVRSEGISDRSDPRLMAVRERVLAELGQDVRAAL